MSFSKFWQCCFPKKKEQIVDDNKEESYEIKNTSGEKKIDNSMNTGKDGIVEESQRQVSQKIEKENNSSSNQPYLEHKKAEPQMIGSFTSFGFKRELTVSKKLSHKSNKINMMKELPENRDNEIEINTNLNITNNKNYNTYGINNNPKLNDDKKSVKNSKKSDESNTEIQSLRVINDEEVKNSPELILEEIMGEMLRNNKLLINAAGLSTGLRKAKDGLVFFGFSAKNLKNVLA